MRLGQRGWNVVMCLGAVLASVVAGVAVTLEPGLLAAAAIAGVGLALLLWRPPATLLFLLIVCQELSAPETFGGHSYLLTLGREMYFTHVGRVSVIVPIAALAAVASIARRPGRRWPMAVTWLSAALALIGCVLAVQQFDDSLSRMPIDCLVVATPWLLVLLGIPVGLLAVTDPVQRRATVAAGVAGIVTLGAVGGYLLLTGQGAPVDGGGSFLLLYQDTATAAVFTAVLVAFVLHQRRWGARHILVTCALAAGIVLSFRRSIWISAGLLLVLLAATSPPGRRLLRRMLVLAVPAALLLTVYDYSLVTNISQRMADLTSALGQDGRAGSSATNHVQDVLVGWGYATSAPFGGLGVNVPQLPGLAVTDGPLYVHNEFLQTWLRFGVPGIVLLVALVVVLVVLGLRACRTGDRFAAAGGALLVLLPLPLFTAPFLSTTARWPLLVGIAAGLAVTTRAPKVSPSPDRTTDRSLQLATRQAPSPRRS